MTDALLLVCTANVCRSPLMEIVLSAELGTAMGDLVLASAGTEVGPASRMCVIGARLVGNDPASRKAAAVHAARPVSPDLVAAQDLIITAARLERSQIAKMDPSSRVKTFTLREAVALGEADMTVPERRQVERSVAAGVTVATAYADLLNGRRGRVLPPREAGMRLPWQRAVHPMDVPDIHGAGSRRHHAQLRALRGHTAEFANQLAGFAAQIGSAPRRTP